MEAEPKFHLSQPPELFARIDSVEPEVDCVPARILILTTIDKAVNWGRKNAIWPMSFGLACCAIEMIVDDWIAVSTFRASVRR